MTIKTYPLPSGIHAYANITTMNEAPMYDTERVLRNATRAEVIDGWVNAAASAGAHLPREVGVRLHDLFVGPGGRPLHPSRSDVVASLYAGAEEVARNNPNPTVVPRGMTLSLSPRGGLDLYWETETHVVRLCLYGPSNIRGGMDVAFATCRCRSAECAGDEGSACYRCADLIDPAAGSDIVHEWMLEALDEEAS